MALVLNHLRTAPPPTVDGRKPLLPGAPPPSHLPLNPILYLTLALDSVAPLFRMRNLKGMAGGGQSLPMPDPLAVRQRRRIAMKWILDSVEKKKFRGSGRGGLAQKIGEEIISIVEGKSSLWEKRGGVHKLGVLARANITKWKLMQVKRRS